ncbi:MAG: ATP synthase F1 subunit gamma [Patescibacteria group bacterium]
MAQTKTIQRRIRSVSNAKQITKALEVVAASRMRRVQDAVAQVRKYGQTAEVIMRGVAGSEEAKHQPFFEPGNSRAKLYIIITSDRGQAGAFNSNIFREALDAFGQDRTSGIKPSVIVFGRKGARFFSRLSDINLLAEYQDLADFPDINVFAPVLETIERGMTSGEFAGVHLIYTEFVSALGQKAIAFQLLPVDLSAPAGAPEQISKVYEFEPEVNIVVSQALKLYFEAKLMQARVESAASEHAMRMVAMGNANRNASDLIDDLTLELNATRQAAITQEIAEITGGAEAMAT